MLLFFYEKKHSRLIIQTYGEMFFSVFLVAVKFSSPPVNKMLACRGRSISLKSALSVPL